YPVYKKDAKKQERQADVVEDRRVAQVGEREGALYLEPHAVVAAEYLERDAEVIEHLRESERDHDEVDAAGADRDRADGERDQRRGADRDRPLQPAARHAVESEDADRVRADTEVSGVAERHHAAVAEDQVEAGGGNPEDQDAPHEVDVEGL